jgi:hypothetical protein
MNPLPVDTEWTIPGTEEPLSQGDILLSRDLQTGEVKSICWVITADCDISKNKFGAQLACLRITSLKKYIRTVWSAKRIFRLLEAETGKIGELLTKWNKLRIEDATPLSSNSVIKWVKNSSPEEICSALNVVEEKKRSVIDSLTKFLRLLQALEKEEKSDPLSQLIAARSVLDEKNVTECREKILKQAQGDLLPEDVFLLPDLPQIEIGPCLVNLRELVGVPLKTIYFRASEATSPVLTFALGVKSPCSNMRYRKASLHFTLVSASQMLTKPEETEP